MGVVDTNVLVHSSITASPDHAKARDAIARLAADERLAVLGQILREFLSVTTGPQPWARSATLAEATGNIDGFIHRFTLLHDGPAVWETLMALTRSFVFGGKQVHDANIVATMLAHGETRLLTFNGADFRRFGSVMEVVAP